MADGRIIVGEDTNVSLTMRVVIATGRDIAVTIFPVTTEIGAVVGEANKGPSCVACTSFADGYIPVSGTGSGTSITVISSPKDLFLPNRSR